jgi:hypothetical protein
MGSSARYVRYFTGQKLADNQHVNISMMDKSICLCVELLDVSSAGLVEPRVFCLIAKMWVLMIS